MELKVITKNSVEVKRKGGMELWSYGKLYAWKDEDLSIGFHLPRYSTTTSKHVNKFLRGINDIWEVQPPYLPLDNDPESIRVGIIRGNKKWGDRDVLKLFPYGQELR